ncbi:MAG: diol dehydratase reactivase subunit alpha, partial [Anaerovoracaceae bacterium]
LIGHNPDTPGGVGLGVGTTIAFSELRKQVSNIKIKEINKKKYIVVVEENVDFHEVAAVINDSVKFNIDIAAAIVKKDDGVLISNRLKKKIPIVDEVESIEKVPINMLCAVEVAEIGAAIDLLSNPYGVATVFNLTAKETRKIMFITKALIGNRSAVIIKTPKGEVTEKIIPAGEIIIHGNKRSFSLPIEKGSKVIMEATEKLEEIVDVTGTKGTNISGMLEKVRVEMSELTETAISMIKIKDIMAVDTIVPRRVLGNLANEFSMEQAVGIAAMVKTQKLQMEKLASQLASEFGIKVEIGGVEGSMAVKGALTTPGTTKPLLVLDIGAGSTDACMLSGDGKTKPVHLAGAGNMVTMLIDAELGINDINQSEKIKKYPLAKVESLFHIRHEDGSVEFFEKAVEAKLFARVVLVKPDGIEGIDANINMEKIKKVRREAKEKVLIANILRALKKISITGNINDFEQVILVGGSSLDFELGNMVTDKLSYYGIVSGKANIRSTEGPRNAVATGLLMSYGDERENDK